MRGSLPTSAAGFSLSDQVGILSAQLETATGNLTVTLDRPVVGGTLIVGTFGLSGLDPDPDRRSNATTWPASSATHTWATAALVPVTAAPPLLTVNVESANLAGTDGTPPPTAGTTAPLTLT